MKRRIYKRYRTRKKGGQSYWVNYGSKFYHPSGKIVMEKRPIIKGQRHQYEEETLKGILKRMPSEDLALVKRIVIGSPIRRDSTDAFVPSKRPKEIYLPAQTELEPGAIPLLVSPHYMIPHEIGHIKYKHSIHGRKIITSLDKEGREKLRDKFEQEAHDYAIKIMGK